MKSLDKHSAHNFGKQLFKNRTQVYVCTYSTVRQCLWWFRILDGNSDGTINFDEIINRKTPNSPWENDILPFVTAESDSSFLRYLRPFTSNISDFTWTKQITKNSIF